ncbi:MAG: hypothetical protein ACTS3F_11680 [Phycisphaerales bacterium]
MLKRTAIIELSRDRLSVIVPSTTAPSSSSVLLDPDLVSRAWREGLEPLDERLHELITESGVRGGTARLVYTSPDTHASVLSLPANAKHAERAALLAMGESSGFPLPEMFAPAMPLVVDRPSDARQCHWLTSFDRGEHLVAAASWMQRAGVRPEALLPMEALALARAVGEAIRLDSSRPGGPAIAMRIGRSCSAIAGVHNGRLLFARPISLSVGTMVAALCGPIYPTNQRNDPDTSLQPVQFSRETAAMAAFRAGFSTKAIEVDGAPGITARDLRPILQPILQRLVVEVRQTLRFGIPSAGAAPGSPRLLVSGAGVAVNGLVQTLGEMLEVPAQGQAGHERLRNDEPTSPGSLLEAVRLRDLPKINLLTGEAAQRMARRRLTATAAAGIVLAIAVGGGDLAGTLDSAERMATTARSYAPMVAQAETLSQRREQLATTIQQVRAMERGIEAALTPSLPAADLMRDLSMRLPESIRLLEMELTEAAGTPMASLRLIALGQRADGDEEATGASVASISEMLLRSPLVEKVSIGTINRQGTGPDTGALTLDIDLALVPIPAMSAIHAVADVPEEGMP